MFGFLFRRGKRAAPSAASATMASTATTATKAAESAAQQAAGRQTAAARRDEALATAAALPDEAAAIAFLCSCPVADARLLAAEAVHSRAGLEEVRRRLRDTDRRVVRLVQQRLARQDQEAASLQRAQAVLTDAQRLTDEPTLRANQVVALEQAWQAITPAPAALQAEFTRLHSALEQRLQTQAGLQRRMLDAIADVRRTLAERDHAGAAAQAAALQGAIDRLVAEVEAHVELPGLPRHLLPELIGSRERLRERVDADAEAARSAEQATAISAAEAASVRQAAAEAAAVDPAAIDPAAIDPAARDAAAEHPAREAAPLQRAAAEQAALVAEESVGAGQAHPPAVPGASSSVPATSAPAAAASAVIDTPARREQRRAALAALQAALEEGALQKAMEQDRLLRTLDADGVRPAHARHAAEHGAEHAAEHAALQAARAELARLQGWARWGGAVSRDEMVASVEALQDQGLPIAELARKVGSMRERWRALDATAGAAPRALWLRFDAACNAAYAPVVAHRADLALQRQKHADEARALLAEIAQCHATLPDAAGPSSTTPDTPDRPPATPNHADVDWRALAAFCQRMQQAWRRIGPLDRREQKRLDLAFAEAMQPLRALLAQRQATELAMREALIAEAAAMSPLARETPERLQALQARWQQQAKGFPLPREQEQTVWERFRQACDQAFAARKQAGAVADAQRTEHLERKRAICDALVALGAAIDRARDESDRSVSGPGAFDKQDQEQPDRAQEAAWQQRLRSLRADWDATGPAPRAAQDALQARYAGVVADVEARLQARRRNAAAQRQDALLARTLLCLQTESAAIDATAGAANPSAAQQAWHALPALMDPRAVGLQARFDAALAALAQPDPHYAARMRQAQAERDALLLRLEMRLGLPSPPHLARERMAQQVAELQSTLKGATPAQQIGVDLLTTLLNLPALADDDARQRIGAILRVAD